MATPRWAPGHLYLPGALVQPLTAVEPIITSLDNPGFDDGTTTGWSFETIGGSPTFTVVRLNSHAGTYNLGCDNGVFRALNDENPPVNPGLSIRAQVQVRLSQTGVSGGRAILAWYDSGGTLISYSEGALIKKPASRSERWVVSTVAGVAPAGAASVKAGFWGEAGVGDGDVRFDTLSWDYTSASAPAGLIYRAVQPAAGVSNDVEPVWPNVLGVQVIDNEVIWEAVLANRVVWQATPIMVSGADEPVWPTTPGERITDNTISWETVSRRIEDENCPNTKVVAILASKVFGTDKDIVRFCATTNPKDWTSEKDAGYLPTGLQQSNANDMAVLQPYRSNLAAFNASIFQNWQVDPNPEAMAIIDQMDGVGSSWQRAAQAVGNELLYLSQLGVRSVGIANAAENLAAGDVGSPIDPLVRAALLAAIARGVEPIATYYPGAGQYWLAIPRGEDQITETEVFVYSMTQGPGRAGAWSRYAYPFVIEAFAQLGNDLYIRHGDVISVVSEGYDKDEVATWDIHGDPPAWRMEEVDFPGVVWFPYHDFGQPGVTKMLEGVDYVGQGQGPAISIGFDQRDLTLLTDPYQLENDTMPGGTIPIPVSAPTFSVKLEFAGGEAWTVQGVLVSLFDLGNGP